MKSNYLTWKGASLNLTWWGAMYHKCSCTLSIISLKLSRFIWWTPRIIDLNNVNRRSDKTIFPLTGQQNLIWFDVDFFITTLNQLCIHINFFRNLKSQKIFFQVFEDPSNFLEVGFLYFHTGLIQKTEVIMT